MKHFNSTLTKITEQVYTATTAQEAKTIMIDYLETTNVKDKKQMIWDVSQLNSLTRVWSYYSNALLKFEGLGVGVKKD
tara:strand:- start:609 stop:842 length:234 start_codon:yes stop_codon:yes gene_type:complete